MHSNISDLVKNSNLNAKLATLAPKAELIATPLCSENVSKVFSVDGMNKT